MNLHPRSVPLQYHFQTSITADDYTRLGSNLTSWQHLNELLILQVFTLMDLKKLLIIELSLQARKQVLQKLRSRIITAESKHIQTLITNALPRTQAGTAVDQALQGERSLLSKVRVTRSRRSARQNRRRS